MSLIVIFLLVEIWPIAYTLDGNFVDVFLKYMALIEQKDLIAPLMLQDINMHEINALNENPQFRSLTVAQVRQQRDLERDQRLYSVANSISLASSMRQSDYQFNERHNTLQYYSPYVMGSTNQSQLTLGSSQIRQLGGGNVSARKDKTKMLSVDRENENDLEEHYQKYQDDS